MIAIYKHPARLEYHASIVIPDRGGTYYQRGNTMFERPRIKVAHHRIFVHLGPRYLILVYDFDGNQITTIPDMQRPPPWKIIDNWHVTESRVLLYTRGGDGHTSTWVTTLDGDIVGKFGLYTRCKSSTASNIVIDPYRTYQHYVDISERSSVSGLIGQEYSSRKRYLYSLLGFHVMIGSHHIAIKESDESPGITNIRTFEVGGTRTEWISLPARFNTVTRVGEFVLLYNPQHEQVHVYRLQPRYRYPPAGPSGCRSEHAQEDGGTRRSVRSRKGRAPTGRHHPDRGIDEMGPLRQRHGRVCHHHERLGAVVPPRHRCGADAAPLLSRVPGGVTLNG